MASSGLTRKVVFSTHIKTALTSQLILLNQFIAHHNTFTSDVCHHIDLLTAYLSSQNRQIKILCSILGSHRATPFVKTCTVFPLASQSTCYSILSLWTLSVTSRARPALAKESFLAPFRGIVVIIPAPAFFAEGLEYLCSP
ncbi:hypothetical protein PoB_001500900 [Plakobranchus ocellatus]|uniref:Uncharacterized protein n=1 Tax=Plakobranchus ocellatus TaxID=259542 RepID=A0AAV3Z274_9GAST|nr:hypothetical protein PoB_001500900 [Plakobranchus ocellatus]